MIEQRKIQAEASHTDRLDRAHSHAADQSFEDANRPADHVVNSFTGSELEDQEERDALDSTEAYLLNDTINGSP
jgi:hypothetical protein